MDIIKFEFINFNFLIVIIKIIKFSEPQIIKVLKEVEQGRSVPEVARELRVDKSTIYYWRKRYGGMEVSQVKRLKEL